MSHLLDSNTFIDHMRKGAGSKVTTRLMTSPAGSVYLCSVVLGELLYGANHGLPTMKPSNLALVTNLRQRFPSLPFDDRAAEEYADIRENLTTRGLMISSNDLMIPAIARANQLTLVTHNTREFSRVPGLTLEDWQ